MKFTSILLILFFVVSCSQGDKVVKHTKEISRDTQQVAKNTDEVAKDTSYHTKLKRQNDAANTRSHQFQILVSDRVGMGQKLSAAAQFFKNFEYQLWNPEKNTFDTIELRESLQAEAVTELYRKLSDIYKVLKKKNFWGSSKANKMNPLDLDQDSKGKNNNNNEMIFYALASMSHTNNVIQVKSVKANDELEYTESIYDLIRHSLYKEKAGAFLSQIDEVLLAGENKDISVALLQSRFNILLAMAVEEMATTKGLNFGNKFSRFWYNLTGGGFGSLKVKSDFENRNLPTQKDINYKLSAAIKAKNALEKAGFQVEAHEDLQSIINNIEINDSAKSDGEYRKFLAHLNALSN